MIKYTFTDEQLFDLLQSVPDLFREYMHAHGYTPERAAGAAANDTIEGLLAERELFDHGELESGRLTQAYPGFACPVCHADYVQSGVENF